MQIEKQDNTTIINMKGYQKQEMAVVAEALMKISKAMSSLGLAMTIRTKNSNRTNLDRSYYRLS